MKRTVQQLASLRVAIPPNRVIKDKAQYTRKQKHKEDILVDILDK